jgi:arginine N-succinyltransferase
MTARPEPDLGPCRYLLRPVSPDDLDDLARIAQASAFAINSLPDDRDKLRLRIERSMQAFATEDDASGEEAYLFVLEDGERGGRVIGTSGIVACAGFRERFYSYRNEIVMQDAPLLGQSQRLHTLHLCHDLTGCTLLSSFFIEPEYEDTLAPQLLSRARLLFIHAHADRFSERIVAENPGLADHEGHSPFWDAVGRQFFNMDYPSAERLSGGRARGFIAELMPRSPLIVPLLPESAQWAIGQLHPVGELPFSILQDEGFETDTYVDVFDAGPTVDARLPLLRTVRSARQLQWGEAVQAAAVPGLPELGGWQLVLRGDRHHAHATLARLPACGEALPQVNPAKAQSAIASELQPGIPIELQAAAQRVGAPAGETIWLSALHTEASLSPATAQEALA